MDITNKVVIKERYDGVYMLISPDSEESPPLDYPSLIDHIKTLNISDVNFISVKKGFKKRGQEILISTSREKEETKPIIDIKKIEPIPASEHDLSHMTLEERYNGVFLMVKEAAEGDDVNYGIIMKHIVDKAERNYEEIDYGQLFKAFGMSKGEWVKIAAPVNRFCKIEGRDNGFFLTVKNVENIKEVFPYEKLLNLIKCSRIANVNKSSVLRGYTSSLGKRILIAPPDDPRIRIETTYDKMKAYLTMCPHFAYIDSVYNRHLTLKEVVAYLESQGITYGLKIDDISGKIENKIKATTRILAAEGKYSQGMNIKYLVEQKDLSFEKGDIDFENMSLIQKVNKGEILAEVMDKSNKRSAINVLGEEVKLTTRIDSARCGEYVLLSDDGKKLLSDGRGEIIYSGEKIGIRLVREYKENISRTTETIISEGSIIVDGSVLSDAMIESKGDVEISGNVENARIIAEGSILIKGGVSGVKSKIKAKRNVIVRHIEEGSIKSGGIIYVKEYIRNAVLLSANGIYNYETGGVTEGSELYSYGDIKVQEIKGKKNHKSTEIHINTKKTEELLKIKEQIALDKKDKLHDIRVLTEEIERLEIEAEHKNTRHSKTTVTIIGYLEDKLNKAKKVLQNIKGVSAGFKDKKLYILNTASLDTKVCIGNGHLKLEEAVGQVFIEVKEFNVQASTLRICNISNET